MSIKIEDINIGDTVYCEKKIESAFNGGHYNKDGHWAPNDPKAGLNPVKFFGTVYCIMGTLLMLDLPGKSCTSVHLKHVVKYLPVTELKATI